MGSSQIECSQQDDRKYASRILSNKLHVLLISDKSTDKASAAMDVRVGSLSDPDYIPGLAHFLEHMLFMGTTKYPNENEYNVFLSAHGGSSNAFTDSESTNFYFDVNADHFRGALDRFAQFFIDPLFTESATNREMQAVDSENGKNLQSDYWRLFQLTKSLSRDDHPFKKFGTGNLETLKEKPEKDGINVREELIKFHKTYYSSNIMKLVLLGKESLDELEMIAEEYFSSVPNFDLEIPKFPGNPYPRNTHTSKMLHIVPVKEIRTLEMNFPMREIDSLYLTKPNRYIGHLLGHEGKGSVLALLKELGLANELGAGEKYQLSDWSMFSVSIELTDAGVERVNEVIAIVFYYLDMLRDAGPQEWIHEETSIVADCNFRFLSKRNPIDYTCSLAGAMHLYPVEHIISGPYKLYEYDPESVTESLDFLVPSNLISFLLSRTFAGTTTSTEYYYNTEYSECDFPDFKSIDVDSLIGGRLAFPEKNDMIATDFSIKKVDGMPKDEPKLLLDSDVCRLWYKPDNVFSMPKVNVVSQIKTPKVHESPAASVLASMYVQILREHCTDFTYLASMASLHCSFIQDKTGIELHVTGYSHKLNVLMGRIVDAMIALPEKLDSEVFERIKDKTSKSYSNFLFAQPYSHAFYAGDLCIEPSKFSIQDKISALSSLTMSSLVTFSKSLFDRFQLEMLVHGNASPSDAKAISSTIIDKLKPQPLFSPNTSEHRVVQLASSIEYIHRLPGFNPDDANSCLEVLFQIGPVDIHNNAILSFLHHLMKEPAFNELRSTEQLGYIVHTGLKTNGDDIKNLLILIQSDAYDPTYLDKRIEAFLQRFREKIVSITQEEFQQNVEAVVEQFLEKNKNLGEESSKYWGAITNKTYLFKKYELIAREVKTISRREVVIFFDKYIAKGGKNRKKLNVQVFGKNFVEELSVDNKKEVKESCVLISSKEVSDFKRGMSLFPLPKIVDVAGMKMDREKN